MSKIINLNGVTIDLHRIKAIFHNDYEDCKRLRIIMNNRKEYIFNPNIDEWVVEEISEDFFINFPDNDTAVENCRQMQNIWEFEIENNNVS